VVVLPVGVASVTSGAELAVLEALLSLPEVDNAAAGPVVLVLGLLGGEGEALGDEGGAADGGGLVIEGLTNVALGELPAVEFATPHPGGGASVLGDEANLDGEGGRGLACGFDVLNAVVGVVVVARGVIRDGHCGGVLLHGVADTAIPLDFQQ
jgi:hypothetical protein